MPELPNRNEIDEKLAGMLALELDRQRSKLLTLLGDPPDARRVPPSYWLQLAVSIQPILLHDLEDAFTLAARQQADGLGHEIDDSELQAAAMTWAVDHVQSLVDRFIERTRAVASEKLKEYHELQEKKAAEIAALLLLVDDAFGTRARRHEELTTLGIPAGPRPITPEEHTEAANRAEQERRDYLGRYMDVPFGRSRAESIAVTGHTTANTAGERHVNGGHESRTGVRLTAIWQTEEDSRVCPICRPLDGLPEVRWPHQFKLGPPAHPNCRCVLIYEPAVAGADYAVNR